MVNISDIPSDKSLIVQHAFGHTNLMLCCMLGPNDLSNRVGRYRLNNDSNNHVITNYHGNQTMPEPTGN